MTTLLTVAAAVLLAVGVMWLPGSVSAIPRPLQWLLGLRRLEVRLRTAGLLHADPWRWRTTMLTAGCAVGATVIWLGAGPIFAVVFASSAVRSGAFVIRARHRAGWRGAGSSLAADVGRACVAHLARGVSPASAVVAAAQESDAGTPVSEVLGRAAADVQLGAAPGDALERAAAAVAVGDAAELRAVAAMIDSDAPSAAAVSALRSAVADLEEDARVAAAAAAACSEPRTVAIAIPALTVVVVVLLSAANPAFLAAYLTAAGAAVLATAALLALGGAMLVRRMTA